MYVEATGQLGSNRVIKPIHKSFSFTRPINEKSPRLSFRSYERIQEWDEIIVYEDDTKTTKIYAGIAEKVTVRKEKKLTIYAVSIGGYKRTFDRKRVNKTYQSQTLQAIVEDIVDTFTEGFTHTNVSTGTPTVDLVRFNFEHPTVAIKKLARAYGYSWKIDLNKDVHFFPKATSSAPFVVSSANANLYRGLELTPDVENFANVVVVRGGTELSENQTKEFLGDGLRTLFYLPEKPSDLVVEVDTGSGYATKTIAPKFGEEVATTEFLVNYNEKYIENGTHAVLSATDKIRVTYKFEYPIRIMSRNESSILSMQAIYPSTDGEFEAVINDDSIDSRDLAVQTAAEYLRDYANTEIKGKFKTYQTGFEEGQIISISTTEFTGSAVVQKVKTKSYGGGFFEYTVDFATVLFDFEDFLRELYEAKRANINENEAVEILHNFDDNIDITEATIITKDLNRITETIDVEEKQNFAKNGNFEYVYGEFFPFDAPALDFTGGDYVNCGTFDITAWSQISISLWFDPDTLQGVDRIFSMRYSGGDDIRVFYHTDKRLVFSLDDGSVSEVEFQMNDDDHLNKWHHVVATFDGTNIKLYLNNVLVASGTGSFNFAGADGLLYIGASAGGGSGGLNGRCSQVAMWDTALDADDVNEIYKRREYLDLSADFVGYDKSANLQAWWKLEESSADTDAILDSSGNGNHGTSYLGGVQSALPRSEFSDDRRVGIYDTSTYE